MNDAGLAVIGLIPLNIPICYLLIKVLYGDLTGFKDAMVIGSKSALSSAMDGESADRALANIKWTYFFALCATVTFLEFVVLSKYFPKVAEAIHNSVVWLITLIC